MATSRQRLSFSTPPVDVPEETGKICSPCRAPHTELSEPGSWKNLQAQEIALTQLSLTLASRVCRPCRNDICRLINSTSITPRWEKGGTRPKCCISNCYAMPHHLQHQKLQLVSKYLKSFHDLIFHALHHCVSSITIIIVYDTIQSKQTHCFTCNSSLRNCRMRVCPNPKLVQKLLDERTGFEETIPAIVRVCAPCYKAHLLIYNKRGL